MISRLEGVYLITGKCNSIFLPSVRTAEQKSRLSFAILPQSQPETRLTGLLLDFRQSRELPGERQPERGRWKDPTTGIPSPGPWSVRECSVTGWKKRELRRAQPPARAEPFLSRALLQHFPCTPRCAAQQRWKARFGEPRSLCSHQALEGTDLPKAACPVLPCYYRRQHFELPAVFLLHIPSPPGWAGDRNLQLMMQFWAGKICSQGARAVPRLQGVLSLPFALRNWALLAERWGQNAWLCV